MLKYLLMLMLASALTVSASTETPDNTDDEPFMCKSEIVDKMYSDFSLIDYNEEMVVTGASPVVKSNSPKVVRMWLGMIATRSNEDAYKSNEGMGKIYVEIDATNNRYRMLQVTWYNCNGFTSSSGKNGEWDYIVPNSMMETAKDFALKNATPLKAKK